VKKKITNNYLIGEFFPVVTPIELKYLRNTSLNKTLLGQSKDSHTEEQMLQISAAKMG
jgi:hypothetical protein